MGQGGLAQEVAKWGAQGPCGVSEGLCRAACALGEAEEKLGAESAFSSWPEAQHLLDLELSGPRAGWFHVYGSDRKWDLLTQGAEAA